MEDIKLYLEIAVDNIIEGNVIAFPTNSVYGIGGDPLNSKLTERIFDIKYREREKGFLLLVSDFEEASRIAHFNNTAKTLAKYYSFRSYLFSRNNRTPCPRESNYFRNIKDIKRTRSFWGNHWYFC
ncbi:MAG: L-threonylcarbamoyladenylate synthase [Promethearchaeota archaeon]